jgi:isoleucyl-tRNA synthetase
MRKEAGLEVSDRIRVGVSGDPDVLEAMARHRDWIGGETLATAIEAGTWTEGEYTLVHALDLDGSNARVGLGRS